jgi:metallo-beta-lactamase family protein
MRLSFHGADREVTGSCHLLDAAGKKVLIDCGLLQGSRELDEENAGPFGFEARAVDFVVLTHAHLDHCGRLPLLAKRGFKGEIISTAATAELANLVMMDAAHMQGEEKAHRGHHTDEEQTPPLYTPDDAQAAIRRFGRKAEYGKAFDVAPGVRATFFDAGHILGSASVLLEATEGQSRQSILFSGDIGNAGRPLLRAPQTPQAADWVVMETTYGDRLHKEFSHTIEEFYGVIAETLQRGGNVVIPSFALERTQELLFYLREAVEQNRIPPQTPVFVDSPLAASATDVFERHPESYNEKLAAFFQAHRDPFAMPGLKMSRTRDESMAINKISSGAIIMAGSGMATGGRIRHHLKHNLPNPKSAVVFVGYASPGTPARRIIDGASHIRLFGEDVPVRASIHTINGFSAHADQRELLQWHASISQRKGTFLVHGEAKVMNIFAAQLKGERIEMPSPGQSYELK